MVESVFNFLPYSDVADVADVLSWHGVICCEERQPVLYLHRADSAFGWQARGVWKRRRRQGIPNGCSLSWRVKRDGKRTDGNSVKGLFIQTLFDHVSGCLMMLCFGCCQL